MPDRPEDWDGDSSNSRMGIRGRDRRRVLEAARQFRKTPTRSEQMLWGELRDGKLGVKFRRQHPIGFLVVDFYCPLYRLIVEVDGPIHEEQRVQDLARQQHLEERGYRVLRLTADVVERDMHAAITRVRSVLGEMRA